MGREPPLQGGVGERFNSAALDLGDALVPDVVGSDLRCRVAEHERRDALRIVTVKLLRDDASDRQSDDRRASNAQAIQKAHEVARIVGHVVLVGPRFGKPVAALVMKNDPEIGREDFGHLVPDPEVGPERIDEDKRRPVAPALVEISGWTRPLAFMNFMGDVSRAEGGARCGRRSTNTRGGRAARRNRRWRRGRGLGSRV